MVHDVREWDVRALLCLFLVLSSTRVLADGPVDIAGMLADGDKRYGDLDYRGAAEISERAARDEHATPVEKIRGWERSGLSWLVMGQRSLAREAFDQLFTLDPGHIVDDPSLSPRQREFIDDVRKRHPAPEPKPIPKPEPVITAPVVGPVPIVVDDSTRPVSRRKPVWKRWYVWTPIALVVVGVGVGVGLGLGLQQHAPNGTLGTVGLGLRY